MKPSDNQTSQRESSIRKGYSAVFLKLRTDTIASLLTLFEASLDQCDDVFTGLAERTANNNEQLLYLECTRELSLQRESVSARFRAHVAHYFDVMANRYFASLPQVRTNAGEPLSLVAHALLDSQLAFAKTVANCRAVDGEQLRILNARLDFLVAGTDVDAHNSPFDPAQLCSSFAKATDILHIDNQARAILLRQFEQVLLSKLEAIYASANEQLIAANVLPVVRNAAEVGQASALQGYLLKTEVTASEATFDQLSALLHSLETSGRENLATIPMLRSCKTGPAVAHNELCALVAQLQSSMTASTVAECRASEDLRSLLQHLLDKRKAHGQSGRLHKPDEDIINLVAMFFEFVLEDRQLPVHIQALIGRLQFPILKTALQDKTFFSDNSHPARQLINEIVSVGIDMADNAAQTTNDLYNNLAAVIQSVKDNTDGDQQRFEHAVLKLREYRHAADNRAIKIEQRTCAKVQAEAATAKTIAAMRELIFERLRDVEVPLLVQDFLVYEWQPVLVLTNLKYGVDSVETIEAVQTLEDVLWSAALHNDKRSQQRLQHLLPDLQERLRKGLRQVATTSDSVQQVLQPLLNLQAQLLKPHSTLAIKRNKISGERAEALHPAKSWSEMSAPEREQVEYRNLSYEYIKQADDSPLGAWFSIQHTTSDNLLRCKLAAKIAANDSYVFVNRMGFKVLVKKRKEFAYDLQQQFAKPLQAEQFFEHTLGKVVSQLQQLTAAVSA